ncbi:Epa1p-like protein [Schistosoma japonicum]|nr:Epa1p-like protein [Schistosoma japonicum]
MTSVNTSPMMNTSLKKINKSKINSDKLCRRTLCNNNNNQLTEYDKMIPTCTPPPIPPRTTSRSQTYQGKMIVLKPKCHSVTNSPIISTQDDINNSHEYLQHSTKNTLHIHSTSSSSTSSPSAYINTNVDDVRLNHFSKDNNSVSVSLQCKHSIDSKINSMISTIRKQSIENSMIKSSIPSTTITTSTSSSSSSSSSLLSSSVICSIIPNNLISNSSVYTTNMNELHRNLSSINSLDVNNVNKELNEQVKSNLCKVESVKKKSKGNNYVM